MVIGHDAGDRARPGVAGQQHRAAAARRDGAGHGRAAGVAVSTGSDLQNRGGVRGHSGRPRGVADGGAGCPANPGPADALLGSRPVVGALFLPGRQDGRAGVLGQGARLLRQSAGVCLRRAYRQSSSRGRSSSRERSWSRWLVGSGRCRPARLWLPRLWPSPPGPARWCLVAADPTRPAAGSCRAAGHDRVHGVASKSRHSGSPWKRVTSERGGPRS